NEFNRTLKLQKIQEAADLRARALAMENDLRVESLRRQQAAESQLVELAGRDPFRFGAARMGQRAPTQTPVDIFRGQLQQTATSPVPQFNPNATMDEITNNIRSMEQFTTQQPYRPPGLERGGKIGQKGAVEPFKFGRPDPHTMLEMADKMGMTPIITGERAGGPELMLAPKGTTVIPLTDEEEEEFVGSVPGAQFGGTVSNAQRVASGFGQQIGGGVFRGIGKEFMPSEFAGGVRLGRLFRATRDALARRGVGGAGGWKDVGHAVRETLRTPGFAGFNPSNTSLALLQGALERESGAAEGLSQFAPLQFLRRQAGATGLMERGLTDAPLNTRRFREIAPSFGFLPPPAAGAAYRTPTPQDAYTGAIYSPITGVLPSPHKIAFSFKQLDPSAQASVLSAYALAGVPEEAFLQQVNSAGIRGSARTGISA
ncbi:MAG TPA: hypothetical protein VJA25_11885, partial [Dehalococcoidia bacterium]|nr:hypothetical protein [Dehalococcoidia bacterium]